MSTTILHYAFDHILVNNVTINVLYIIVLPYYSDNVSITDYSIRVYQPCTQTCNQQIFLLIKLYLLLT